MNPCFSTIYEAAKKYNACIEGLRAIETAKDESDYISHRDIRVFAYWITTKEPELATVRKEYNEHIMKSMKKLDEIIVPSSGSSAEIIELAWKEYNATRENEMELLILAVKEYYTR